MARKRIDWETIEREYRLGQKSIREIAREHTIQPSSITRKATREKWQRDHSEEIRQRTKATLQSNSKDNTPTREDIDKAVQTNIEVIQHHRIDIRKGRDLVGLLSSQLDEAAKARDQLEYDIIQETEGEEGPDLKRRNAMFKAISLPSHAGVLRDLSVTLKNLIPLERQAFNIDEHSGESGADVLIDILNEVRGATRGLPNRDQGKIRE